MRSKESRMMLEDFERSLRSVEERPPSIFQLLKMHHSILQEATPVLKDPAAFPHEKRECLKKFMKILEAHTHAEEAVFYESLKPIKGAQIEIYESLDDHQAMHTLMAELTDYDLDFDWDEDLEQKALDLAEILEIHMRQEEEDLFAIAREYLDVEHLHRLSIPYLESCKAFFDEKNGILQNRNGDSKKPQISLS